MHNEKAMEQHCLTSQSNEPSDSGGGKFGSIRTSGWKATSGFIADTALLKLGSDRIQVGPDRCSSIWFDDWTGLRLGSSKADDLGNRRWSDRGCYSEPHFDHHRSVRRHVRPDGMLYRLNDYRPSHRRNSSAGWGTSESH